MASTGDAGGGEFAIVVSPKSEWQERRAFILSRLGELNGIEVTSTEVLENAITPSRDRIIIRGLLRSCREEDFENLTQFVQELREGAKRRVYSLYRMEKKTIKTQRDSRKTRGFGFPAAACIACHLLFVAENVYRVFGECARAVLLPFNILFLS